MKSRSTVWIVALMMAFGVGPPTVEASEEGDSSKATDEDARSYFWGQIQKRADAAHEHMEDDIEACLDELGDSGRVREIALHATREGDSGPEYEVQSVMTNAEDGVETDCAQKVAEDYVDRVGTGLFDDFEHYAATFIARPDSGGECDETRQDSACADWTLDESSDRREPLDESSDEWNKLGDCDDELVDTVESVVRDGLDCRASGRFTDRISRYEDRPLRLRAVLLGEVRVDGQRARAVIRFNQPWVGEIARCLVDELERQVEIDDEVTSTPCRTTTRNLALGYWNEPIFTYISSHPEPQ